MKSNPVRDRFIEHVTENPKLRRLTFILNGIKRLTPSKKASKIQAKRLLDKLGPVFK